MSPKNPHTLMESEAREAPAVAARLVEASGKLAQAGERLRLLAPRFALTVGRGSSGAAAMLAKYLFEERLGLPTATAAPSIRSVYGRKLALEQALVLAVSQSGRSPDIIEFCRDAAADDVLRLGLVNAPDSPLAEALDICLPLEAWPERSVSATKSCLAAMTLSLALVAHWRDDAEMLSAFEQAPHVLARALELDWADAEKFLTANGPMFVVGRGPGLAIAEEAALKLKETAGIFAEALSAAELRHGPLSLAGPDVRVLIFAQRDAAFESLTELAAELEQRGSPVLCISAGGGAPVSVPSEPEPVLELLAMLQRFYLLANDAALKRGRSPDAPPHLTKVTETR